MNKAALLAAPLALLASIAVSSPGKPPAPLPENAQWSSVSQGPFEQRFSPLAVINQANVKQLGLAWYADMPSRWGLEATPIYADGVLYVSSAFSVVHAYSVATGKELWSYDPGVYAERRKSCCTASNRGSSRGSSASRCSSRSCSMRTTSSSQER